MEAAPTELMIEVQHLRLGMYVFLNLGWMDHPFPLNRFKITTEQQIEQIRGLKLKTVKVLVDKSDPKAFEPLSAAKPGAANPGGSGAGAAGPGQAAPADEAQRKAAKRQLLEQQNASLVRCESLFSEAAATWKQISALSQSAPETALVQSTGMVDGFMREITGAHETSIRLLSEISGDGGALHALNVTVVSLLLGRAMKLDDGALGDIGLGALLHDIGKQALPDRLRWRADHLSPTEELAMREHVSHGLQIAIRMGLSSGAQQVIFQHHETADGKGYPKGAANPPMSDAAKVVSLVNAYDNLCNPGNPSMAVTPHEALSLMFARLKPRFDPECLTAFIRLMGVYPPGSLVQLSDERYAMVVSVNAARPLKPCVIVFDTKVPREEALLVDLQADATLGIRRSLQPRHLSSAALDYLSPRKRMTYFFERAINASPGVTGSALVLDGGAPGAPSKAGA